MKIKKHKSITLLCLTTVSAGVPAVVFGTQNIDDNNSAINNNTTNSSSLSINNDLLNSDLNNNLVNETTEDKNNIDIKNDLTNNAIKLEDNIDDKSNLADNVVKNESDGSNQSLVNSNTSSRPSLDSSAPQSDTLLAKIDTTTNKIVDNNSLNNYLYNFLKVDHTSKKISNPFRFDNYTKYQNVDILYVNDSANLKNSTFTIKVKPTVSHSWIDGKNYEKTIVVKLNLTKNITLPSSWSLDAVARQYAYNGFQEYWHYDSGYLRDYEYFAKLAKSEIMHYYGDSITNVEFLSNYPKGFIRIYDGTDSYFWVRVYINKDVASWSDSSKSSYKDIRVDVYGSSWKYITNNPKSRFTNYVNQWYFGRSTNKDSFSDMVLSYNGNKYNVPNQWVSKFLTTSNVEFKNKTYSQVFDYMTKKIYDDAYYFFSGDWIVNIEALTPASNANTAADNYKFYDSTWVYDLHLTSRTVKSSDGKTPLQYWLKGYAFTRTA